LFPTRADLNEPEAGTAAAAAAAAAAAGELQVGIMQLQTLQRQIATHTQLLVQVYACACRYPHKWGVVAATTKQLLTDAFNALGERDDAKKAAKAPPLPALVPPVRTVLDVPAVRLLPTLFADVEKLPPCAVVLVRVCATVAVRQSVAA
jgi:hypothetical protein